MTDRTPKKVIPTGTREMRRPRIEASAQLAEARARARLAEDTEAAISDGAVAESLACLRAMVRAASDPEAIEIPEAALTGDEKTDERTRLRIFAAAQRQAQLASSDLLRHFREVAKMAQADSAAKEVAAQHLHLHGLSAKVLDDPQLLEASLQRMLEQENPDE